MRLHRASLDGSYVIYIETFFLVSNVSSDDRIASMFGTKSERKERVRASPSLGLPPKVGLPRRNISGSVGSEIEVRNGRICPRLIWTCLPK